MFGGRLGVALFLGASMSLRSWAVLTPGNALCPCLAGDLSPSPLKAHIGTVNGQSCAVLKMSDGTQKCIPTSYGLGGCAEHDKNSHPSCKVTTPPRTTPPPQWCGEVWCYVDKTTCDGQTDINDVTISAQWPSSNVYYSYKTCGSEMNYAKWQQSADATATKLRTNIETYVKSLRKSIQDTFFDASATESLGQTCTPIERSCNCASCTVNKKWEASANNLAGTQIKINVGRPTITLPDETWSKTDDDVKQAKCMSSLVASKFKNLARREYNDYSRHGMVHDDHRSQGSMNNPDRWSPTKVAAKQVLRTLGEDDYATIVTFSSSSDVFNDEITLHAISDSKRKAMFNWIDAKAALGGTNFKAGFQKAKECFEGGLAAAPKRSSSCVQVILFLTDGVDGKNFKASDLSLTGSVPMEGIVMLTYSIGDNADEVLPKKIACQHNGIWRRIADNDLSKVGNAMASYYQLFAANIDASKPRWSQYLDSVTNTALLTSCLPIYNTRVAGVKALAGVVCMDLNVVIDLATFRKKNEYSTVFASMQSEAKKCPTITYTPSIMRRLRLEAGGEQAVCTEIDQTDEIPPAVTTTGPSSCTGSSCVSVAATRWHLPFLSLAIAAAVVAASL